MIRKFLEQTQPHTMRAMETETIQKNGASPKSLMSRGNFRIVMIVVAAIVIASTANAQINQNQNNNTIVIQNNTTPVVIEKKVYIDRYRTVYVDRPQPKRVARKLAKQVQLLGYLWVFPEDLGDFKQQPLGVIESINAQNMYGRDNWRIPTPDELAVLENNAETVGLGDDIYLATDHSNGVLRLVSTGNTNAQINAQKSTEIQKIKQKALSNGTAEIVNGTTWATTNIGGRMPWDVGKKFYLTVTEIKKGGICPTGWRLPTKSEFVALFQNCWLFSADGTFCIGSGDDQLGIQIPRSAITTGPFVANYFITDNIYPTVSLFGYANYEKFPGIEIKADDADEGYCRCVLDE
ncbi:MAG: hypothetical protein LBP63_06255 [Prevotellaceae bacterium]|jgi:hypothetical protein|nr:hypothetical protein [Prevotellaceae bacterium]